MSIADLCRRLQVDDPWPLIKPTVPMDPDENCFSTAAALLPLLRPDFLVVEFGSWLGASTRFFARNVATVIAIDHWLGSPEHQPGGYAPSAKLPTLYETFLVNCWEYRETILPLRMSTDQGIALLMSRGIVPDLVYVDADHSYEGCRRDIEGAVALGARTIAGDDFDYPPNAGVRAAVLDYARDHDLRVRSAGQFWTFERA